MATTAGIDRNLLLKKKSHRRLMAPAPPGHSRPLPEDEPLECRLAMGPFSLTTNEEQSTGNPPRGTPEF
ncbi:MAG: hypothetical protein NTX27_10300 [Verrucomicrobia bacterium]|nr:hypothetical protein [Verrucomicrobiota bacterium]